jgi:putative ABC transport system ATP-binding protein
LINLRDVAKSFGGPRSKSVLAGISLAVASGELVAILGESGVGKSTLLNLLAGLERTDHGSIVVDGRDLGALDDDALTAFRRTRVGFVFQAFHILPYLTVAQNIALPLNLAGLRGPAADRRVEAMLDAVGMNDRGASPPYELSGGEMQRVAIARALVHRPAIVLADEPTGNLDPDNAGAVLDLLCASVRSEGATGVLVTHSRAAARRADRVLLLQASGLSAMDLDGDA